MPSLFLLTSYTNTQGSPKWSHLETLLTRGVFLEASSNTVHAQEFTMHRNIKKLFTQPQTFSIFPDSLHQGLSGPVRLTDHTLLGDFLLKVPTSPLTVKGIQRIEMKESGAMRIKWK